MTLFEKVKKYYDLGIYKKSHVAAFVAKGKLTPEQYAEIVGEDYET